MKKILSFTLLFLCSVTAACSPYSNSQGDLMSALRECKNKNQACFEAKLGPPNDYGGIRDEPNMRYATWKGNGRHETMPRVTYDAEGKFVWNNFNTMAAICEMHIYFEDGLQVNTLFEGDGCGD